MSSVKPPKTQKRSAARLAAVQSVYQKEIIGSSIDSTYKDFVSHKLYQDEINEQITLDTNHLRNILLSAEANSDKIESLIAENLSEDWQCNRLENVLRCILISATAEFLMDKDLAAAIIINEYVNVTRKFYDKKESNFVNGMLDKIARSLNIRMKDEKKDKTPDRIKKDNDKSSEPSWRD